MNRVCIVGNLTRDPELRTTPGGTSVGSLRVAVNEREKVDGEWTDRANYFDVTVWGNQADNCAQYLAKGRKVGVDGRLRWREWETTEGTKRQAVEIVADRVEFLSPRDSNGSGDYAPPPGATDRYEPAVGQAAQPGDLVPPYTGDDDPDKDIPF